MPTVQGNERTFDAMGFGRVKSLALNNGLPPDQLADAIRWVAKREEEERLRQLEDQRREREEITTRPGGAALRETGRASAGRCAAR